MRVAARRPEPIPVYAEMSSINPVFLLPSALAARGEGIARGFVDSLVLGGGQFCTNPGLGIAIDGDALKALIEGATTELSARPAQTMLTPGIYAAYQQGEGKLAATKGVAAVAYGLEATGPTQACAALFVTDAPTFLATPNWKTRCSARHQRSCAARTSRNSLTSQSTSSVNSPRPSRWTVQTCPRRKSSCRSSSVRLAVFSSMATRRALRYHTRWCMAVHFRPLPTVG
jgi:hypothetical protein